MGAYDKFLELPKEKQLRIINAGFEYFGKYGYKNANTEDIAKRAEISKGLLFYYFKNKEQFYLYLCEFCQNLMLENLKTNEFQRITDFFELIDFGTKIKLKIIAEYPFITDFAINMISDRAQNSDSKKEHYINSALQDSFDVYFQNIDVTLFKRGINPKQIYQMMMWLTEGYVNEKKRLHEPIILKEFLAEFDEWKKLFKQICYEEEYHECN